MRDSLFLDPRPGRRLLGWLLFGIGCVLLASALALHAGADELAPVAAWPARLAALLVGPSATLALALLVVGVGADVLVARLLAYLVFRVGGGGLIVAAVSGWSALPFAAAPEQARAAFEAGGLLGSILVDYRALDLSWRLGPAGAQALFVAAALVGGVFGVHTLRQALFGSLYSAWVARRERTTRHGLKLLENASGVRCVTVDPEASDPSVRAKVSGAVGEAVRRTSGIFRAVRTPSRPGLAAVVTPDPDETLRLARERLAMGIELPDPAAPASEASTAGLSARWAEPGHGAAPAVPPLAHDARPVGEATLRAAATPRTATPPAAAPAVAPPAPSPRIPISVAPRAIPAAAAATATSLPRPPEAGAVPARSIPAVAPPAAGPSSAPRPTTTLPASALPPAAAASRPAPASGAVTRPSGLPAVAAPASAPAAPARPALPSRRPVAPQIPGAPLLPAAGVAGGPPRPAIADLRPATTPAPGPVPGPDFPRTSVRNDRPLDRATDPSRPAAPLAPPAPPAAALRPVPATASPSSPAAPSNPIGRAYEELKRELELLAATRDTAPPEGAGSAPSARALDVARLALGSDPAVAPAPPASSVAPAPPAPSLPAGDPAATDAAASRSGVRIFTLGREGARPAHDDMARAAQDDGALEQPAPADWFARYTPPPLDLLARPSDAHQPRSDAELRALAGRLAQTLADYGVDAQIAEVTDGPVVTLFELTLGRGVKVSKITQLETELALALGSDQVRVLAPVPGRATIGVELARADAAPVVLRQVIEAERFWRSTDPLLFALGLATDGEPALADLATLPHLLIAGATGTGKSVFLNALICSVLYHMSPEMVRFLLIDPKRVEMNMYEAIPHLAAPIVSEPEEAAVALEWVLDLMEERYRRLQAYRARNLASYNQIARGLRRPPRAGLPRPAYLPHLVVVIDELADLILTMGNEVETPLVRLAQMARAVGIHLVVATQRPSVDVITGLIKANFPSRVAFQVSSKVDSRTILDANGAECLRGRGDLLFSQGGALRPLRMQGPYIGEEEVERLCDALRAAAQPWYWREEFAPPLEGGTGAALATGSGAAAPTPEEARLRDELYFEAIRNVLRSGEATQAALVRRMHIGRTAAMRLLERMEQDGLIQREGRQTRLMVDPRRVADAPPAVPAREGAAPPTHEDTGSGR